MEAALRSCTSSPSGSHRPLVAFQPAAEVEFAGGASAARTVDRCWGRCGAKDVASV